jgi:hypothetical protein
MLATESLIADFRDSGLPRLQIILNFYFLANLMFLSTWCHGVR